MTAKRVRSEIAFGRTELGQALYDVCFSRMSAAEAARRHKLNREFVLKMRKEHSEFRRERIQQQPKKGAKRK